MATPSVPDGYGRASLLFSSDNATHVCVCTFNYLDAAVDTANNEASTISVNWNTAFPLSSLADTWHSLSCNVLINRGGSLITGVDNTVRDGTRAVDPPPVAAATIMRKRTGVVGRAHRGRLFLPAGYQNEADIDDAGVIDATRIGQLNSSFDALLTGLQIADMPMWLVSNGGVPRGSVTTGDANPKIHWLRRRNLG